MLHVRLMAATLTARPHLFALFIGRADSRHRRCFHQSPAFRPAMATASSQCGSPQTAAIVWFRNDLRITDHEPLHAACSSHPGMLLPVYCLDPRDLLPRELDSMQGDSPAAASNPGSSLREGLGIPQLGPFRLRALLEALAALDTELQACGSHLAFHQGPPEEVLARLVSLMLLRGSSPVDAAQPSNGSPLAPPSAQPSGQHAAQGLHYEALALHYYMEAPAAAAAVEAAVEAAVQEEAAKHGVRCSIHRHWGATLYHPDDLPYQLFGQRELQQAQRAEHGRASLCGEARALVDPQRFACLPGVMTNFRKPIQANARVRQSLPRPDALPPLPAVANRRALLGHGRPSNVVGVYEAAGPAAEAALCRLESLVGLRVGSVPPPGSGPVDPRCAFPFTVGEPQALRRLRYYLGEGPSAGVGCSAPRDPHPMHGYQDSRMLAYGVDTSTKLSPFLALGCLSPRTVYWEALRLVEQEERARGGKQGGSGVTQHGASSGGQHAEAAAAAPADAQARPQQAWREPVRGDGVRWLLMHLGIRDFFIYTGLKEGPGLLRPGGIQPRPASWHTDPAAFERWARGQTGLPFVDACMRELGGTGFMSNRGRQNAASLLAKGLGLDWRLGLLLFESLLVDHDYSLNLLNWAYNAGTGNDPRDRQFKTVSQGEQYDPEACLIKSWVPELAHLPAALAHRPWLARAAATDAQPSGKAQLAQGSGAAALEAGAAGTSRGEGVAQQASAQQGAAVEEGMAQLAPLQPGQLPTAQEGAEAGSGLCGSYPPPMVDPLTQVRREPGQSQQAWGHR